MVPITPGRSMWGAIRMSPLGAMLRAWASIRTTRASPSPKTVPATVCQTPVPITETVIRSA
ncbi:hypothetical protein D3C87_1725830 [compost metagenome]